MESLAFGGAFVLGAVGDSHHTAGVPHPVPEKRDKGGSPNGAIDHAVPRSGGEEVV